MNSLEQSIIQTLAYFSVADFPLTKEELYRHIWCSPSVSYTDFVVELAKFQNNGKIVEKFGFYFLPGQEHIIEKRRSAVICNDQKLHKAKQAVRLIKWVPFLKTVMVCNSVGREVSTKDSDIDFFIITEKNRLWIVRFFTNFILRLFRLRTYGKSEANRICLSFYVDTAHLNLAPYKAIQEDIHFAYWIQQMVQAYDTENWYEKLLTANSWANTYLPHRSVKSLPVGRAGRFSRMLKKFFEIAWKGAYGSLVEKQAKEMQWMKLRTSIKDQANNSGNGVVIADGIIKLHEHDARIYYRSAWIKKLDSYAPTT